MGTGARWAAVLVALAFVLAAVAAHADGWSRRRRANLPIGWRWPPTQAMKQKGQKCLRDLRRLGVAWKRARRRRMIPTPVVVPTMEFGGIKLSPTYRKPPFVMDCHLARVLARYGPLLRRIGVRELRFSSIHDYRRVRLRGGKRRALSRHALGLAIDVFEVVLEDDTTLKVDRDYWSSDATLRIADVLFHSRGGFRAVLTPGVDPKSHDDHFHLEAKYRLPRAVRVAARKEARKQRAKRARRQRAREARQRKAKRKARRRKARREARKKRRRRGSRK